MLRLGVVYDYVIMQSIFVEVNGTLAVQLVISKVLGAV
jgi:hypothetical protein